MHLNATDLKPEQINEISDILVSAFSEDLMLRYITPESEDARLNALKWNFKIGLRYCQTYNHIYTTPKPLQGVAAWIPPGVTSPNIIQMLPILMGLPFKFGWRFRRALALFGTIEERRKKDMPQPHWYLALLGVAPAYQGQGIGGQLLQPVLGKADIERFPCYLETFSEKATRFYQKQGFEIIWQGELPGGSPPLWTMKREVLNS